uniref:START domain-containing protein n=1 Tax=Craspedostauros australis TaxID=1486917 RepID=A0A7R9WYW5_9STRA|mmetsp:Transcript_5589/g.15158  ORF Transcript_5589/g.15158 Transcript_5589/m.15158 type:complete len:218 (+) Transcript_5589:1-654(+)
MVPMKPEELVDLMVDSSRVKEYNKMSLGRQDIFVLNDDLNLNESSSIDDDSNSCGAAASHMDSRDDKETCTSPVSSTVLSDRKQSPFGRSITKVVRAVAKPPIIRRTLAFVSLLHATELEDKSGYLIVTRAVYNTPADRMVDSGRDENGKAMSTYGVITNEILLGVNLIKRVQDHPDRCIMINVNHVKSPVVPVMIAKRLGVSGAVAFINDIRALCN